MILTCPDCATRYVVADHRIGARGRAVRCAACGARWTAGAAVLELAATDYAGDAKVGGWPEPPQRHDAFDSGEPDLAEIPSDDLPKVFRERAQTHKKVRQAAATGVVWAAMIGALALVLGAAVLMRQDVAQLLPRTAAAYAMIGLPVNLAGMTIEEQRAQPALKDGHAAVVVSGALRNVLSRSVAAPPLRISLLNAAGKAVDVKIADPGGAKIPAGEARRFSVDILDPPVSATDVEISFVLGQRPKALAETLATADASPPPPAAPETPELRGPATIAPITDAADAAPEPSSSPYALPAAAASNTGALPQG